MRGSIALVFLILLVAGCASPTRSDPPTPSGSGPLELGSHIGLLALELEDRRVASLTTKPGLAWMSSSAAVISWMDETFSIVVNDAAGTREVGPQVIWSRIHDNATGLEIQPELVRLRGLENGTTLWNATLPPAPLPGAPWTAVSDDLSVLGGEYGAEGRQPCASDIFLNAARDARTIGCHLQVARDGRAGWTEQGGVRVMDLDGTIRNVTGPRQGDASTNSFVAHENPFFTKNGTVFLRLTGGATLARSEIVDEQGNVFVSLAGPKRLALLGASDDGQRLLVRVFQG